MNVLDENLFILIGIQIEMVNDSLLADTYDITIIDAIVIEYGEK